MRNASLLAVLSLSLACQRADQREPNAAADSSRIAALRHLPSPAPAAGASSAAALDPGLDSTCADAMRIVRAALELPLQRDSETTFAAPRDGLAPWHGCRITASSAGVPRDPAHPVMPDGLLQSAFLAAGWKDDFNYGADGIDGTELGMRKKGVLCHLAIRYQGLEIPDDPSIDSPPEKLLKAFPYSLVVSCTRNPMPAPA